ncbi:DUF1642 domain-containing protein [Streptococcus oralis]|uniref:DUF1642 domain-containing protein n=1 Tax=Streptococcus oralis TaxID=1303 RepID=UPI002000E4C4|nr:DUF1642 domain-containing protein [Streptococcus oralis]
MNKKELIEKYKELENGTFDIAVLVVCQLILKDLELLDEPQPVKVPQFVADWIEVCKEHLTTSLYTAMNPSFMRENNQSFDLALWIKNKSNQETFALAWILGYEVEEEKRYRISMPKARNYKNHAQFLCEKDGKMFWCAEWHRFRTKFTHKELEDADFGWVFDCQGVEVEEVQDET